MPDFDDLNDLAKLALDIGEDLFLDWAFDSRGKKKKERTPKTKKKNAPSPTISGDPWDQNHPKPPWEGKP